MLKYFILSLLLAFSSSIFSCAYSNEENVQIELEQEYYYAVSYSLYPQTDDHHKYKIINYTYNLLLHDLAKKVFGDSYKDLQFLETNVYLNDNGVNRAYGKTNYFDYINIDDYINLMFVASYYGLESKEFIETKNHFILKAKFLFLAKNRLASFDMDRLFLKLGPKIYPNFEFDLVIDLSNSSNFSGYNTCSLLSTETQLCTTVLNSIVDHSEKLRAIYQNDFKKIIFKDVFLNADNTQDVRNLEAIDITNISFLIRKYWKTNDVRQKLVERYFVVRHRYEYLGTHKYPDYWDDTIYDVPNGVFITAIK